MLSRQIQTSWLNTMRAQDIPADEAVQGPDGLACAIGSYLANLINPEVASRQSADQRANIIRFWGVSDRWFDGRVQAYRKLEDTEPPGLIAWLKAGAPTAEQVSRPATAEPSELKAAS